VILANAHSARCLVVGGKGFIGSHLVDALVAQGTPVCVFDRADALALTAENTNARVEWCDGDFASGAGLAAALAGCDTCFHLVSTTLPGSSNADPVFDVQSNVVGSIRLLEEAVRAGVRKVVFVSSGGTVYGTPRYVPIDEAHPTDPISSYGIAKLAIEKYLRLFQTLHGLDYAILRPSNPFGERQRIQASQGAVAVFLGKALKGETVEIWGDGSVVRDYLYIGDLIAALLAAQRYSGPERIFNIGSGDGLSLNQLLDGIAQVTGRKVERRYLAARAFDVPANVLAVDRARQALGWAPATTFLDGLARTAKWMAAR
jgi:UDP-glucose 4-epimerase